MNLKKIDLSLFKGTNGKSGSRKNALSYPHSDFTPESLPPYPAVLMTPDTLITHPGKKSRSTAWLEEHPALAASVQEQIGPRALSHHQMLFDKYDTLVTSLLQDMAAVARWGRWAANSDKTAQILKKQGEEINGWGWVVYRLHSSGEAILPDQEQPANYTLFNFWQVSFTSGHTADLSPDLRLWDLHAYDTLDDVERLMPGQVERWLKEQLFKMYQDGCLWVALPDQLNEKGKRRKPTILDALHTYNVLSFGRNYDLYQTEAHFYDRPPFSNQFIPGYYKR